MQEDYDKQLEAAVGRELDALPDLTAPKGLSERVMRQIEMQTAPAPWYRRAWPAWPAALRFASLGMLLAALTAIGIAISQIPQSGPFALASSSTTHMVDRLGVAARTFDVLLNSLKLVLGSLSALQVTLLAMVVVGCYAVCLGVGTIYYRLAFVRR